MHRKILAAWMALVALGATPAVSSAARLVDGANTTSVANGAGFVAYNETNQPTILEAPGVWKIECEESTITGSVHNNGASGGIVTGTITHVRFQGNQNAPNTECKSSLGPPVRVTVPSLTQEGGTTHWCIQTVANTDNFVINPHHCTQTGHVFTIIIDFTGSLACGYVRSAAMTGTFTTGHGGTAVTLTLNSNLKFVTHAVSGHSIFCPSELNLNNFKFEMFTDTDTTNGTYHHAGSLADPLFITNP